MYAPILIGLFLYPQPNRSEIEKSAGSRLAAHVHDVVGIGEAVEACSGAFGVRCMMN